MSKQIVSIGKSPHSSNTSTDTSTNSGQARVFCGIDVSRESLAVAVLAPDQPIEQREFANSASGHKALLVWLGKYKTLVRGSLEATGIFSMDLALALDAAAGIEVAVLNPKRVHDFAKSMMRRSKTDRADAAVLAEFSMRMEFVAWQRPSQSALQLRAISRHLRRALYMPALSAVRCDPHLKAFYESLLSRHKTKLLALIAVARKLLHAIYGIFKSRTPYDGSKLFPQLKTA